MRAVDTYRTERRNDWRTIHVIPWAQYNQPSVDERGLFGTPRPDDHIHTRQRSKYLPHESVKRGGAGPVFA